MRFPRGVATRVAALHGEREAFLAHKIQSGLGCLHGFGVDVRFWPFAAGYDKEHESIDAI